MDRPKKGEISPTFYVVIALTVLAPWLGGTVTLWAQTAITLGTGVLLLLIPPKKSLGPLPNFAFAILFALSLAALLPAHWFSAADWRSDLAKIGIQLPDTVSPQPWITLQSALLFLLELSWAYYLLAADWSLPERRQAWLLIATAITALAGALVVSFLLQRHIPFWPNVPEFGFFPNRNHTSNVLGLGGILVYAMALRRFDERRKSWWIWLVPLSLISSALILNYSRSGIILLCGGVLAWHIYWLVTSEDKRRPLIASVGILLILGLFAWDGGKTAVRFGSETADFFSQQNMRFLISRDAIAIRWNSPFTGIGLGNFNAIFNMTRHEFLASKVAGHPESDWVWAAVELGWLGPLLIASLLGWWMTRCLPFEPRTLRLMRMAVFICGCTFALHGLLDVPGHEIGALWPAVFLASTAIHPAEGLAQSGAVAMVFRVIGASFIVTSVFWLGSLIEPARFPTKQAARQLEHQMTAALDRSENNEAIAAASAVLHIAPLNWFAYRARAAAELSHSHADARRDFLAARYLLPGWSELWLKEGVSWAAAGEVDRAFEVWSDMLQRFPKDAGNLYDQIYTAIKLEPDLVDRWHQLGRANKECLLIFLQNAGAFEFQIELQRLLFEDRQLRLFSPDELKIFFAAWYKKGDKLSLAETLREHPEWEKIAWRQLSRVYADYQDYRPAYETLARFTPRPSLPEPNSRDSIEKLTVLFRVSADPIRDGIALALMQAKAGQLDNALATLTTVAKQPRAPTYIQFLEAEIWAQKSEWNKAWEAMWRYDGGE